MKHEKILAIERHKEILDLLQMNGNVKISDLVKKFRVSRETIRRDLIYLDKEGLLKRGHGGAIPITEVQSLPTTERIAQTSNIKQKLCSRAFDFIRNATPSDVIYLDAGSTISHLAKIIATESNLSVVTASLSVCDSLLDSNNTIIIAGGQVNSFNRSTIGPQTIDFFKSLHMSIAFLGTNGFEQHSGPAVTSYSDAEIKKAVLPNAKLKVVISDSSKAYSSALIQYANWLDIDYFITDSNLPQSAREEISKYTNLIIIDI